ncbi:cadherin domain-containing protein [Reichenbachiella carrageenanivorans]|uniref:Cadherin domain-containing protein n=1 Tax=Reichenbachiella carrageenanivorans TaxID=2979869 RepID=A0ABY6CXK7_9BACT|nr:cadherin domain-containing protein [Reichenbachiella carrageenanivorans]UXX78651.1 cadherin domain-containing protein [Reichenbachiella carrageenanivorans]
MKNLYLAKSAVLTLLFALLQLAVHAQDQALVLNNEETIADLNLNLYETVTISFWAKTTGVGGLVPKIVDNDNGGFDRAIVFKNGEWVVFNDESYDTNVEHKLNEWVYIAVVFSSTHTYFFENGFRLWSGPGGSSVRTGASFLTLGEDYSGIIDELAVWSDERTTLEVIQGMTSTPDGTEDNLVAYYDFNDGTITDQTANGYDGSSNNTEYVNSLATTHVNITRSYLSPYSFRLSWEEPAEGGTVDGYYVVIDDDSDFSSPLYDHIDVGTDRSYDVLGLCADAFYYIGVQAYSDNDVSRYSRESYGSGYLRPIVSSTSLADLTDACSVAEPTAPTATDQCANVITGTNELIFPITTQGETTIVWTYEDADGNIKTQNQKIIIDDNEAPEADQATLPDITAECSVAEPSAPTATDNCRGQITGTQALIFPITTPGETTIVWTYTDDNGNTSTQNQKIVIEDVTAPVPVLSSLPPITANCSIAELPTAPTATDNCDGTIVGVANRSFPINYATSFTLTWTFEDAAGNTSTLEQAISVTNAPPVPDVENLPALVDLTSVTPTPPTATDDCDGVITATTNSTFPITEPGFHEIRWQFEDSHGSYEWQEQIVVIGEIPANDLCADAIAISLDQEVTGTLVNALPEAQISDCSLEPFFEEEEEEELEPSEMWPGVWYSFQGTGEALTLNIDYKEGESLFSVMAGTCNDELVCIGSNLMEPSFSFETVAGEPYLIHVSEFFGESDSFTFSLSTIPTNTSCDVAETVTIGSEVNGTSIGLLEEEDAEAMWYHFVGTGEEVQFRATSIEFSFHNLSILDGSCGGDWIDIESDTEEVGESPEGEIQEITTKLTLNTELDVDYYIAVSPTDLTGSFLFEVLPTTPPANDQCTGAISVSCGDTITGSTEFATADHALAPACGTNSDIGNGVWYRFVGTGDKITLSTCSDDSFDTSLSVYSGACTTGLVCVAGNEDGPSCPNYSSELTFISQLNTEYLILVDGYYDMYEDIDAVGEFSLEITCEEAPTPPTNDTCSDAMALTVYEQEAGTPTQGTNEGATTYLGVVECDKFANVNDVWYSFNSGYNTEVELTATFETAGYLFYAMYESCGGEAIECAAGYDYDFDTEEGIPLLINNVTFEVESNTDYLIQVWNSSQAGTFTLILNDGENTAPSITNSQDLAISRYATSADVLWDFEYEDDEGNDQRFELLSGEEDGSNGDDGAFFAINELTGELYVANPEAFQASDQSYFVMRVKLVDQGPGELSDEVLFEIDVLDDQPPVLDDVSVSVDEGVYYIPSGFEYVLLGSSPDGDEFFYSIVDGNDYNLFMIEDGKLIINEDGHELDGHELNDPDFYLDYEFQNQFVLDIKIQEDTDLNLSVVGRITINLNDLNEYPQVYEGTAILNLNSAVGTSVGFVRFDDPDAGQTHTYSISDGNSAGIFAIDEATGEVTVADAAALLSAGETEHTFEVGVTDSGEPGFTGYSDFKVNVQGTPMTTLFEIAEDAGDDDEVGQVVYDATADLQYSHDDRDYLDNGLEGIPFYIGEDGTIKVGDADVLDFETQSSHQIYINIYEVGIGYKALGLPITINITDVNERPDFVTRTEDIYLSNTAKNGDEVMQVSAFDPEGDDLTYTLDDELFAIDESTGMVTIKDVSKIPFFIESMIDLYIVVSDGELEEITEPTVYLVINAAPTLAVTSMTIDENESAGTLIGTLSSDDVHGIKSYKITSGNDAGHFELDEVSGNLTFVGDTPFDYESTQSYELTVELTDKGPGHPTSVETLTIQVLDVNEAPVLSAIGAQSGDELTTITFTAKATDEDLPANTLSYSLDAAAAAKGMTIHTTTGVYSWTPTEEQDGTHDATVTVSDGTLTASEVITITVNEVDAAPVLSVNDGKSLAIIKLYPNPVVNELTMEVKSDMLVSVVDLQGKVVLHQRVTPIQNTIELKSLRSGLYTVVLTSESKTAHYKVIKN